jgi:transcriptional regulator with PAS, ATPase and Fis domain
MARRRSSATELARLLNSAPQPLYAVDREQTLVFCNRSCLEWTGYDLGELLGQRCSYHSGPDLAGPDAVAAALCPPPQVFGGQPAIAVASWVNDQGEVRRRRVRFFPLGDDAEGCIGVVGLVASEELPETEAAPPETGSETPVALHEHIARCQQQMSARFRIQRLIGQNPVMRQVRQQVRVAADTRATVLIVGPSGSGREHVARTIHYAGSAGARHSLVPLACDELGAELIHSTLQALLSAAGQPAGTLLLGDADRLPAQLQAVLADWMSRRELPWRVIATSRTPLLELAARGAWREDLAAALSTIVISLPALAERREDLPLLAQALLEETNARGTKQLGGFTIEALDRLDAYDWPGNLAELAETVAEAHRKAVGQLIDVTDLPKRLRYAADATAHPRKPDLPIDLDELLANVEREVIRRAMARARGNKSKAAELLGLTRPRLYRRLQELGLSGDEDDSA